ncbi:nucleotidyl transferase AbiEii/AbiGii toxin family protein [Pararhizobium qamdonense]|uniref:nucleotidyl transferase AbiEii/AbiGii toxin family protein n=1 Tax=Pararhizobium qamdonense TaxID=3031126 RepID=UPI0023E2C71A|nr:nucleotidyl transferase AbiEii/AbiGii toxin family protein [Pararhizobium qamdonense]
MSNIDTRILEEGKKFKQRIEAACCAFNSETNARVRTMDAGRALDRATGEEVLRHILAEIKSEPLVKGGYAYHQGIRETADIDLLYMRAIEDWEFERAFTVMAPRLAEKGIALTGFDRKAQVINTNGQLVHRYNFSVQVGPSTVKNHVDVTWGGPKKFPRHKQTKRHGSTFYAKQEPTFAHYQSFESQAADKLLSALTPTIGRWKDYSDLSLLAGMSLDHNIVAAELLAKFLAAGHSYDDIMAFLIEQPETLSYDFTMDKAGSLEKVLSKYGPTSDKLDAMQVFIDVRDFYQKIRYIIGAARIRKLEGKNPTIDEVKKAFRQAQADKDEGKKVVTLSDYRLRTGADLPSQLKR